MEVKILRHRHHVAVALVDEVAGLAHGDTAQARQRHEQRDRIAGDRDLGCGGDRPHPEPAAGRDTELDLVEQPEAHPGVGKDHLHVAARHVLEQLHVDKVAAHALRQKRAQTLDDALCLLAGDFALFHHLFDAHLNRLQLEQYEQALEHRHVDLAPAEIGLADVALAAAVVGGAAVEDRDLLEGLHVDMQVEAVVRILGQDEVHVGGIDTCEIGLLQQLGNLLHETLLHDLALFGAKCARMQQVAVGAERLVGLFQLVQLRVVLLAPPMIEIAEEAARLLGLPGRPGGGRRQAVEQREAGDGDEALLAARALRHHGIESGDFFLFASGRGLTVRPGEKACRGGRRLHVG